MNEKNHYPEYVYAGYFTSRGEWIHPVSCNDTGQIIIVTAGEFEIEEDGTTYTLEPGSVMFLDPGKIHGGVRPTGERVSFYWIHWRSEDYPRYKVFMLRDRYPVLLACRQLLHYTGRGFGSDVADALLTVLLAEVGSQYSESADEDASAAKICEWIRINSDRPLTAADVSERFGYSVDYTSRLLRVTTGMGLKAVISEYKMNLIKQLLLESERSLQEIAAKSGFSDYKLFLKYFRYHEGVTPSEFRSAYYKIHTNNH